MFRVKVVIPNENYDAELFTQLSLCGFSIYWQNNYTEMIDYAIRHEDMNQYQAICIYNGEDYPADAISLLDTKNIVYSFSKSK